MTEIEELKRSRKELLRLVRMLNDEVERLRAALREIRDIRDGGKVNTIAREALGE